MREEYNFSSARKNPYAKMLKEEKTEAVSAAGSREKQDKYKKEE